MASLAADEQPGVQERDRCREHDYRAYEQRCTLPDTHAADSLLISTLPFLG
jgi:hypothetical protein